MPQGMLNLTYGIFFLISKNFEHVDHRDFQIKDGEPVSMAIGQSL